MNGAPAFGDSSVSIEVAENTTAVIYTAEASDANGNSITYSLSGGADQGKFNIGASSGEVRFVNAPDYEAPNDSCGDRTYGVQISASDSIASTSFTANQLNSSRAIARSVYAYALMVGFEEDVAEFARELGGVGVD